jgi:Protein of unknown function (DUF3300)
MKRIVIGVVAVVLLAGIVARSTAQPAPPPGGTAALASSARWTPEQLEALAAPIALYPDSLVGSILAASTYPLEVVEAARWLEDPAHAGLTGDTLAAALEGQRWDPSVKSLMPFADVLRLMDRNLEWTEQLGDAFLAQQADVMDAVQRLRQRALAQGTLQSTPQQTVTTDQSVITIEPASPDVVYVPYYVPDIYGPWPWPGYPPYYFGPPPGVFIGGALIGFGIGIGFWQPWGWYGCNWHDHGVVVYPPLHRRQPGIPPRPQSWQHDPQHRDGVPYRDAPTAARYQGAEGGRHAYRGFPPPAPGGREPPHLAAPTAPMPRPAYGRPPVSAPHTAPPAFESFGHGPQVRSEAARGSSSRSAPPAHGGGGHPGHREGVPE